MESAELNVTFFAAQTIQAKIRSNFRELPPERCARARAFDLGHAFVASWFWLLFCLSTPPLGVRVLGFGVGASFLCLLPFLSPSLM